MRNNKNTVLVTGANGFVGKYVMTELLAHSHRKVFRFDERDVFDGNACQYDHIVAIDMCSAEAIAQSVDYSPIVIPVQMDLRRLVDSRSTEYQMLRQILESVTTVVNIAGVVDTRENSKTVELLQLVNVEVVKVVCDLAAACGVKRFIQMSSGASQIQKQTNAAIPGAFKYFCPNSLFGSLSCSTYARTKLEGEQYVLTKHRDPTSGHMRVCVLRPQAVWGRGDPISTEKILSWPNYLPHMLIGDPTNPMIFCRADNLAKFVTLADAALVNDAANVSGKGFDISDSSISSLLEMHWRMLVNKPCLSTHCFPYVPKCLVSALWRCFELVGLSTRFESRGRAVNVIVLPDFVVCALVAVGQAIDRLFSYRSNIEFVRIMSANNVAYCMRNVVSVPSLRTFEADCLTLFNGAFGNRAAGSLDFSHWLHKLRMDVFSDVTALKSDVLLSRRLALRPISADYLRSLGSLTLSTPLALGPVIIRNRVIKAATFECMSERPTGIPTEELIRFHTRQIVGGVGMTIVAYGSVSNDGRSFPTQINLRSSDPKVARDTELMLRELCESVHAAGGKCCLQLTHAGAFADSNYNDSNLPLGPSAIFNPLTLRFSKELEDGSAQLDRIEADFVHAVDVCRRVGFDAIELHLGHGYLLSQFLSRRTNPKHANDPYKRLEFPLRVVKAVIRNAHAIDVPSKRYLAVLVKFNVSELTEEDLPLNDVRIFARAIVEAGADLLVPSGGHVMTNGLHMLRGGRPIEAMAKAQKNWLKKVVIGLFGEYLIAPEVYREAFFRERMLSALTGIVPFSKICLIGGIHDLMTAECAVGATGFAAVQLGRVLLADPDWCIKMGIAPRPTNPKAPNAAAVKKELRVCDNSNQCIVGATMALQPLRCSKHSCNDW